MRCHNELRDYLYVFAKMAGMHPEREESGLLPQDPRRRPGDLTFASWPRVLPLAMDFAVTSPLQSSCLVRASESELSAATAYEAQKLADHDTAEKCRQHGLVLAPMVVESFGGWGCKAQSNFKILAHARAARTGETVSDITRGLFSGLIIILWRANVRSLLARVPLGDQINSTGRCRTLLSSTA